MLAREFRKTCNVLEEIFLENKNHTAACWIYYLRFDGFGCRHENESKKKILNRDESISVSVLNLEGENERYVPRSPYPKTTSLPDLYFSLEYLDLDPNKIIKRRSRFVECFY